MKIKVAGFVFEIKNKFPYMEQFMTDYLTDDVPDETIDITMDELETLKAKYPASPLHYIEYLETYRVICDYIVAHDGALMHGAVIEYEGNAYMFTATSGTGKTTHIKLWKELYKDNVRILNGDKPLIRYINGSFVAYGTPWCGKEHYNVNASAPLKGIVLLTRGEENEVEQLDSKVFNKALFRQIYMPKSPMLIIKVAEFADKLFSGVPLYLLKCNMNIEAAQVASDAIANKKNR